MNVTSDLLAAGAMSVALAMAAVLAWAGAEKARDLAPTATVLRRLGAPSRSARLLAALVAGCELAVALALVFVPRSAWTRGGVAALAVAFALAGAVALARGETIRCACFGAGGGLLGGRQVVALLPWLAGVALLAAFPAEAFSPLAAAGRLALLGLALASVRAISVWRARRSARGDRISAEEMYAWQQ